MSRTDPTADSPLRRSVSHLHDNLSSACRVEKLRENCARPHKHCVSSVAGRLVSTLATSKGASCQLLTQAKGISIKSALQQGTCLLCSQEARAQMLTLPPQSGLMFVLDYPSHSQPRRPSEAVTKLSGTAVHRLAWVTRCSLAFKEQVKLHMA